MDIGQVFKLRTIRMERVTDRVRPHIWLVLALGLTLILSLWLQMPRILDPYTYQEDFAKFFWMHSYEDPELFTAHRSQIPTTVKQLEIGPLSLQVDTTSPAYSLIIFLASPFFPITLSHKLLLFPLMVVSVYFLFRIGEKIRGPGTGFALALAFAVLNLNAPSSVSLAAGLQRSFVAPVLIILIYSLMQEKYLAAALVIFIGGLFYPPVMVLGILTYALSVMEPADSRWRFKVNWRNALPLVILLGIAVVLLLPAILRQLQRIDLPSFEQVEQIGSFLGEPQYSPEGRYPIFHDQSLGYLVGKAGLFERVETFWQTVILTLLALALLMVRPQSWSETPATLKRLLAASFVAFSITWLAALMTSSFILYLPSRYGRASIGLVLLIFVVTNFETSMAAAIARFGHLKSRNRALVVLAIGILFLAMIIAIRERSFQFLSSLRYSRLRWSLALSFALLTGSTLLRILSTSVDVLEDGGGVERSRKFRPLWLVAGLGLFLLAGILYVRPVNHDYVSANQSSQKLINYLGRLPKDALIASGLCLGDDVPMLAKRSVLWNCEQPGGQRSVLDTLGAYYADSMVEVFEFCQKYDVDYMLVNQESFELDRIRAGNFIFEPYNSLISPQIINRTIFALQNIPEPMRIFESDGITVIPCKLASVRLGEEGLNLLWSSVNNRRVTIDGNLEITLDWINNSGVMSEHNLCLEILDSEGHAVQEQCYRLFPEKSIDDSSVENFTHGIYEFRISPHLENGTYTIAAKVYPTDELANPGEQFTIGQIELDMSQRVFAHQEDLEASAWESSWDNKIALMDYTIKESAEESLEIGLRWLALQRMSNSYKIFAHLFNPYTDEVVKQLDTIPRDWTYPTIWWEKNEVVTDTLILSMSDVDSGQYQLWIGLYDSETLERLPLDQATMPENPIYVNAFMLSNLEH